MGERVKELQKRAKLLEAMLKLHQVKKKLQGVGVDEIEKLRAVDANIKGIETPLECLSDTSASESDSKSDVESRGGRSRLYHAEECRSILGTRLF